MHRLALLAVSLAPVLQEAHAPEWARRLRWAAEAGPPAREHAAFIADPGGDRAILLLGSGYAPYGAPLGDAWAFDLAAETWSELALTGEALTPGGSRRAAVFDDGVLLHGGYGADFAVSDELWRLRLDPDRITVERVPQENAPGARMLHAFACDPAGERLVVFGGAGRGTMLDDTWIGRRTASGVHWERLPSEDGPGLRYGFAFAHDVRGGRLLVCGGQTPPESWGGGIAFARDLWSLDFTAETPAWTLVAEYDAEELPGRRNPAFAWDEATGDLLIWGGTGDGTTALPGLYVLRTREEWAPVERITEPADVPTRASCFGVVDARGRRALLGFGNTGAGPYADLVEVRLRGPADPWLERLAREAEELAPLVESAAAAQLLAAAPTLSPVRPFDVYSRPGGGYLAEAATAAEYARLDEAERAELRRLPVDTERYYATFYGTPLAAVRAYDLAAAHGIASFAGRRVCELGFGSVGQLRLLAACGAHVVGTEVMPLLGAIYAAPGSSGPFGERGGSVTLAFGRWPAEASAVAAVGGELDLFVSKNTIKRGYVAPLAEVPEHQLLELGVSNDEFLARLHDALRPGGLAVFYNLGGAPAPEGQPYRASADIASPWSRAEYEAFGFEVLALDADDAEAAHDYARVFGWEEPPVSMDLERDLFARYTVLRRPR